MHHPPSEPAPEARVDVPRVRPQGALCKAVRDFVEGLSQAADMMDGKPPTDDSPKRASRKNFAKAFEDPFTKPVLYLLMAQSQLANKKVQIDFDHLLYAQELVMLLAHLDAFMADSLRVMCRKQPQILRRNKSFTWDVIIESATWDNLIEKMIEEYAYDFGWMSIKQRVDYLITKHGLAFSVPPDDLNELDNAEKLRHIVIHNGSRVSQEHLDRTQRKDVKIGDIVPVTSEYTESIGLKVRHLGGDLFIAIATKFYKAKELELSGVWRFSKPEGAPI